MNSKNLYKIYQLMEFFINKYSFNNVFIKEFIGINEVWLTNKDNNNFNIIRISLSTLDDSYIFKDRINEYIKAISSSLKIEPKFLDIHVSNETVNENELYNSICIDTNYYSGVEVENIFPTIKNVVHDVDNAENELSNRISSINNGIKKRLEINRNKFKAKFKTSFTNIIIIICLLNYVLSLFLQLKGYSFYGSSIVLGGDYHTFTFGLKQYFRFITYSFVHSSLIHLFFNMYSLFILGNIFERKYGKIKYLIILFSSIFIAGITYNALSDSSGLLMGMSGGIYGLFAIYIIEVIKSGGYKNSSFLFLILINLYMNFLSTIAWQGHLGGAITGLLFYYLFKDNKIDCKILLLIIITFCSITYKCFFVKNDNNIYIATDREVCDIYKDIGFIDYSNKLTTKLYNYYIKVGSKYE